MRSRRYTEEVGLVTQDRPVPTAVAVVVLAIVVVLGALIVRHVVNYQSPHVASEDAPAPAAVAQR